MRLTLEISDELAARLGSEQARLPRILALGLREMDADEASGFRGLADVLEFLAGLPTPEQILALRPSPGLQKDIDTLLERSRRGGLAKKASDNGGSINTLNIWCEKPRFAPPRSLQEYEPHAYSG